MKKLFLFPFLMMSVILSAQTTDDLLKTDEKKGDGKTPVVIFNSERVINANTTELVGKGKMDFKVTHNFGDVGGSLGGLKNFFGLDNTTDVRIGFEIGLGKNLDITIARAKAAGNLSRIVET